MTTIESFYTELTRLDGYYAMSDDPSVYRRGSREMSRIEGLAQSSVKHSQLFADYKRWVWLNPAERDGKKPRLEDYQ